MLELERILQKIDGGNVLDVASGRGEFIQFIKHFKSYKKITAIDIMANSEKLIQQTYPNDKITFVWGNAKELPFEDESFDTVCLSNSLHHLENMEKVLEEMIRVLKKNGNFVIHEMYCDNQNKAQMSHVKIHHWFAKIDTVFGQKHDPTFPRQKIKDMISELDLKKIKILDYAFPVPEPKDPEMVNERAKLIDAGLRKLDNKENFDILRKEGEEIRSYILENGFAPAASLFILGTK
ncbi:MAG: class I SAM-dependent methyltransferase [Candidatus Cloacimonetes bacterium]|nr:class I SAM-dependent methyltransferase [Candidatus Cloacimonadota bacterium]MCF7814006.1 class I SAM-dependent methyltransferase [Candidatus Cloacimonadota bacterium]MCF7867944.1 class I SAM-dependent methyltransferase [Candidatus Cloacimonadota bacterium]MCF7882863.1 class I SAM-dependent methyltransferase [Candidatus Cloacimonadota bacterium]